MKRIIAFIFCISIALSLAGCRAGLMQSDTNSAPSYSNGEICGAPEVKYG